MSDDMRTPEEARIQKLEERMNDMVHVAELRELIDEWRYGNELPAGSAGETGVAKAFEQCANDLEGVIEE